MHCGPGRVWAPGSPGNVLLQAGTAAPCPGGGGGTQWGCGGKGWGVTSAASPMQDSPAAAPLPILPDPAAAPGPRVLPSLVLLAASQLRQLPFSQGTAGLPPWDRAALPLPLLLPFPSQMLGLVGLVLCLAPADALTAFPPKCESCPTWAHGRLPGGRGGGCKTHAAAGGSTHVLHPTEMGYHEPGTGQLFWWGGEVRGWA